MPMFPKRRSVFVSLSEPRWQCCRYDQEEVLGEAFDSFVQGEEDDAQVWLGGGGGGVGGQ